VEQAATWSSGAGWTRAVCLADEKQLTKKESQHSGWLSFRTLGSRSPTARSFSSEQAALLKEALSICLLLHQSGDLSFLAPAAHVLR
jgi:hypothetical protein